MRILSGLRLGAVSIVLMASSAWALTPATATREASRYVELEQEVERCAAARDEACLNARLSPGFRQVAPARDEADRAAWLAAQTRRAREIVDLSVRRHGASVIVSFLRVLPGTGSASFVVDVWDEATETLHLRHEGPARRVPIEPSVQDRRPTGRQ